MNSNSTGSNAELRNRSKDHNEFLPTASVLASQDDIHWSDKITDFLCPVCPDQNLQVAKLNGTQVCACSKCQGFLVDSISLGMLIKVQRIEYRGADDKPVLINTKELDETMKCPTCFEPMYTHPYHGPGNVIVNSCSTCNLNWLDAGELAKIIRAPGRRGA